MFSASWMFLLLLALSVAAQGQSNTTADTIGNLIRSKQYDQALKLAQSLERRFPGDARPYALEGVVLSIEGQREQALSAFDRALTIAPDDMAALRGEIQLLYPEKDPRAIPLLEKLLRRDPADLTGQEMLANLEESEGDCTAADAHFALSAEAIKTHPDSLEAYGACLAKMRQPVKAIPVFEQLVALTPQSSDANYDLALVLVEDQQYAAALKVLEPLMTGKPSDPDLLSLAAEAYEGTGDTPRAVSVSRQAIVLRPDDPNLYNVFAKICLDHESFQVGVDMVSAGLQRVPDSMELYLSRGRLYVQLGKYDKAEADFNMADRLGSGQGLGAYALDLAELQKVQTSHPEAAIARLRVQLKTYPNSALLHYLLAKLLLSQNPDAGSAATEEAMNNALLSVKLKPDLITARDMLADQYLRSGKYTLVIEQCRAALQYDPSDQTALYHLITALRHTGKAEDRQELPALLKQLSALQQASLQQATDRKRFKLTDQTTPPQH